MSKKIKLLVEVDEELYRAYKGRPPRLGDEGMDMIAQAIANGTPITEGDLISREALKREVNRVFFNDEIEFKQVIDNAPPIGGKDNDK